MINDQFYLATCLTGKNGDVKRFKISTQIADLINEVNHEPPEGYHRKAFTDYAKAENYIEEFLSYEDKFRFEISDGVIKLNQVYTKGE